MGDDNDEVVKETALPLHFLSSVKTCATYKCIS